MTGLTGGTGMGTTRVRVWQRSSGCYLQTNRLRLVLARSTAWAALEIDDQMQTGVDGLYVAGEAGSGVFGACRVGDGLVEMMCQGMRAGRNAAAYAEQSKLHALDEAQSAQCLNKIFGILNIEAE